MLRKICALFLLLYNYSLSAEGVRQEPVHKTKEIVIICKKGIAGLRYTKIEGKGRLEIMYTGALSYVDAPQKFIPEFSNTSYFELLDGVCYNNLGAFSAMISNKDNGIQKRTRIMILVTTKDAGVLYRDKE
jgi:hypothetical protein